jgi:hypothetical protein
MLAEFVTKILSLGAPNIHEVGELQYSDKELKLLLPPQVKSVDCSTLQGLVDLWAGELDDAQTHGDLLVHIVSPTEVHLLSRESDNFGRRRLWARADYPKCTTFPFGAWLDPESFIIAAQQNFQRVKIESGDGFAHDLDYVLSVASKITAEHAAENVDDGFAQRVAVKQGIALKAETILKPMVNLAPYRTFAEIDQVISQFVFRARINNGVAALALFEGDGGRWKIGATAAIKAWLEPKFGEVPIIA